jgi:hypothetical protein
MKLKLTRRRFLVTLGACLVGGVAVTVRLTDDRWDLRVSRLTIALPRLPKAFDGLRIAHITDVHRGGFIPISFIRQAIRAAKAERPDLILLTGDYVSRSRDYIPECAAALGELSAPLGCYAVLGNHDYWVDGDVVADNLTRIAHCRVLRNESAFIRRGGEQLAIAGLDDLVTLNDDLDATLAGLSADDPVILLTHSPDVTYSAASRRVDLVLAGHTHGGQIVLPWIGPPAPNCRLGRSFASGLKQVNLTTLYTNRGVGMTVLPWRINCPPEVAIITLRAPQAS